MSVIRKVLHWAGRAKRDTLTLWFACRHPHTPAAVKIMAAFVVAYALSPIDLIPDFIPVLGHLDDALLVPALIWLTLRMLPAEVLEECRAKAHDRLRDSSGKPRNKWGAAFVILIWLGIGAAIWFYLK